MSRDRPILFSGPMARAILEGAKTQTRRVMRTNHVGYRAFYRWDGQPYKRAMMRCSNETSPGSSVFCEDNRFGVPGDRLWVRETWGAFRRTSYEYDEWEQITHPRDGSWQREIETNGPVTVHYRADFEPRYGGHERTLPCGTIQRIERWQSSLHMPRWASRLTLDITDVRIERLNDISEDDARAEGVSGTARDSYGPSLTDDDYEEPGVGGHIGPWGVDNFRRLWDSINGKRAPWASNPWVWIVSFRRTP